jgi:hypothetical protein
MKRGLVDVVGLYMGPPKRAVVFSFDEKTAGKRGADVAVLG